MGNQRATSTGNPLPSGFFPGVEDDAAVRPLLGELATEVVAEMKTSNGADAHVHTELRVRRGRDGDLELVRFYWSRQVTEANAPWGFAARTIYCDRRDRTPRVHVFPSEPALTMLTDDNGPLLEDGRPRNVEVLRYIPLRRVTFRFRNGPGLPPRVIAKAKRPSGLGRAVTAFRAAEEAAMRRGAGALSVPRLLGHDSRRGVLYLEELPGQPLDVALHGLEVTEAMQRLGESHRDLQELEVQEDLPHKGIADWLDDARHAATQIGLFVPSVAAAVEALHDNLVRTAPDGGRLLYCQGDFLPGQILCHDDEWSIIDLDDSRYADPLSDVAALYAALPREHGVPPDRMEEAQQTYLDAYMRRAGEALDEDRWRWFLSLTRLTLLAKRLVKGRATLDEATATVDLLTGSVQ
jgi:aminoglycoside phosphotransferase